ncbi:methylated-DNA-[protein]-cysteine S-methyltransferase [Caulobacter ginsengisoli]|uniref:Methylated-DNA-[protein]-cysteine S-methyltransferase n=1 Tax=Caulobacter ginsengisoli TaxID=400775 RepID=A0ABU0IXL6_9CAUL|nr:methylated-DNA--[protein]-cysteine S-methyltransferase [Caulobacter ginsengisoli]MDQ0466758.1 methylated-DNA-[protein]-cysteine S-methyltransferase [Caulobacter ginsengisoli]
MPSYALFDTAIGPCGLVWGDDGVTNAVLPEADLEATRQRLLRRTPAAVETEPTSEIATAIEAIRELFAGGQRDLADIKLDLAAVSDFQREVYAIARAIPPGETLTYGDIAKRLGGVQLAREVGQAMGKNPIPIIVPCHRVLAAGGGTGGFSAPGGVDTKLRMLTIEKARTSAQPSLFDDLPLARA